MGNLLNRIGCLIAVGLLPWSAAAAETPVKYRAVQSSYAIIGMRVQNAQDQTLGKVRDLAIDLENGRLVGVIVGSSSGFLNLGQRHVAVPPAALWYDPVSRVIRVSMAKAAFQAAPELDYARWAEHTQSRQVAASYRYFGQEPYFAADGKDSATGNTAFEPLGYIQRSSKLAGMTVKNLQDEFLGRVNTVLFDLASGHVFHVIVLAPSFANEKSVIQARALKFNAERNGLLLDVSQQAFKEEPRFRWTYDSTGGFQQESFVNRAVAANAGVNTRQNVQAGTASTYTPLAQGTDFRDVDKTYRIHAAMRADVRLSEHAQTVEVGTLNGQTTLRGHVWSEEARRIIGEIAAGAGRPQNVSNLLEVRRLPDAPRQAN
jgi:sporulation protein YlmC with PRC-barrel domain